VFRRHGLLAVIVPAVLPPPTPFKLFVLLAGFAGVRPVAFTIGIAIGRGFRFGGEGWLAYRYGAQATQYINDNLATASVVAAGIVLLLGVLLILARRRRQT
jgi:LPXTG-motif cell wall-anchored protein